MNDFSRTFQISSRRTAEQDDDHSINVSRATKEQTRSHINRELKEPDGALVKPTGAVSWEFVTETFEYDSGWQVTVYVSPRPPKAIVCAGDGQRIAKWGLLLEKADVPSTMIVGVHRLASCLTPAQICSPFSTAQAR